MDFSLQILRTLHDEHLATIAVLERLEGILRRHGGNAPPGDWAAGTLFGDLLPVLEGEINHHYAFEEEHLFPRFAQYVDPGIPAMLQDEHETIRPVAARMVALIRDARAQAGGADGWAEFRALGQELVEREVFHIQKEEMGFLPALEQIMDSDDDAGLSMTYAEMKG
ncbi:MAG: hemerythrin domain-containing protein [Hyphomicrobiales bacterium]|nr:hemerythrin domain-containing protein [Hyphomicrobiales bacterium]